MTAMSVGHSSFFLADMMITTMHMISLAPADITPSHFSVDPVMLVM
jgi:hypothetical protein